MIVKTVSQSEEQRGKRRTSRSIEILLLILVLLSIGNYENAYNVLELVLPYAVFAVASLRGLDAHYNPKRV